MCISLYLSDFTQKCKSVMPRGKKQNPIQTYIRTDKKYPFLTVAIFFFPPKPTSAFTEEVKDSDRKKEKDGNHNEPTQVKKNPGKRSDSMEPVPACPGAGSSGLMEPAQCQ